MLQKFEDVLFSTIPCIEIGVKYYTKILGLLRQNLLLNNFKEEEVRAIILTIFNPSKYRR